MCLSLNYFCCCIDLSAGAKIVSVISTLTSPILIVLYGTPAVMQASTLPPGRLVFYGSVAVAALLQTVFGCLLVHGTFRKKPQYTWPWIILAWLKCVALSALCVAGTVLLAYNKKLEMNAEISCVTAVYFGYALILFYFVSVVNSRRQQMVNEKYTYSSKRLAKCRSNYYI